MDKNLHQSLFATIILIMTAIVTQAQCYIIGNDNNWVTNVAGAELQATSTEGVYEGDVEFAENAYYFFITTKLTEASDDWYGLRPYRFNPTNSDTQYVTYNTPWDICPAEESGIDGSFKVSDTGTHKIRVDFNDKKVTVEGTYPEHIYMMGTDDKWTLGTPSATLNRIEGTSLYQAYVEFTGNYFAFYTQIANDWDTQNTYRWIANEYIEPNSTFRVVNESQGASSYISRLGTYDVTFDYNRNEALLYDETYVPEPTSECIYFVGNANSWEPSESFANIDKTEDGVYEGSVSLPVGYFAISTRLGTSTGDWTTFNAFRYCPATDGETVGENKTVELYKFNQGAEFTGAFQIEDGNEGTYNVKVDLNNMQMSFGAKTTSAISTVSVASTLPAYYYDLTGRCLGTNVPEKGIYIKGGKKIVK